MSEQVDVCIIGGGIVGLFCALELSQSGKIVRVVDKVYTGSSRHNIGAVLFQTHDEDRLPFLKMTHEAWDDASEASKKNDADIGFEKRGSAFLAYSHAMAEYLKEEAENDRKHGFEGVKYEGDLKKLSKFLDMDNMPEAILGGKISNEDNVVDTGKAMDALRRLLIRNGVRFWGSDEVVEFKVEGDQIVSLKTNTGEECQAKEFLVTAGVWGTKLLQLLDVSIPMRPARCHLLHLSPNGRIPKQLVSKQFPTGDIIVKYLPSGQVLASYTGAMDQAQATWSNEVDEEAVEWVLEQLPGMLQGLAAPIVNKVTTVTLAITQDGYPFLGRIDKYKNLTVALGFSGKSYAYSAGVGRVLKAIIEGEDPPVDLAPFAVNREIKPMTIGLGGISNEPEEVTTILGAKPDGDEDVTVHLGAKPDADGEMTTHIGAKPDGDEEMTTHIGAKPDGDNDETVIKVGAKPGADDPAVLKVGDRADAEDPAVLKVGDRPDADDPAVLKVGDRADAEDPAVLKVGDKPSGDPGITMTTGDKPSGESGVTMEVGDKPSGDPDTSLEVEGGSALGKKENGTSFVAGDGTALGKDGEEGQAKLDVDGGSALGKKEDDASFVAGDGTALGKDGEDGQAKLKVDGDSALKKQKIEGLSFTSDGLSALGQGETRDKTKVLVEGESALKRRVEMLVESEEKTALGWKKPIKQAKGKLTVDENSKLGLGAKKKKELEALLDNVPEIEAKPVAEEEEKKEPKEKPTEKESEKEAGKEEKKETLKYEEEDLTEEERKALKEKKHKAKIVYDEPVKRKPKSKIIYDD
jgi:glycine/D-amino acid oxidase-like deaminating enzyme